MSADQQTIQSKPALATSTEKSISNKKTEGLVAIVLKTIAWIGVAIIGIAGFQYLFALLVMKSIIPWSDRSAFGEMFGGLNTFFSGLAFGGVIYAILLQRKELKLQREELIRSVDAQEKSEQALKAQVEELIHQRRLSILPGFIFYFEKPTDDRPMIKNIGSGVALNIGVEPIPLEGKWSGWAIFLHRLSHLLPNQSEGFAVSFLDYEVPDETTPDEINSSGILRDPRVTRYLRTGEYEFTVTFNDLEGNEYVQKIYMFEGRCMPKTVRLKA